jgi:hypothetical protein
MKINAYICAADPAWVESSVLSYYTHIDQLVVSYDEDGRSWSGPQLDTSEVIQRLKQIDTQSKIRWLPGHYSRVENYSNPMLNDTFQRQDALNVASEGADWVLQIDSDEVVPNWGQLSRSLTAASAARSQCLYYPSIGVYQFVSRRKVLEACGRFGKKQCYYSGPIAVRPFSHLTVSRRIEGASYVTSCLGTVECGLPSDSVAATAVMPIDAIWHLSHCRSLQAYQTKLATWSHSTDYGVANEAKFWIFANRYPILAAMLSHIRRKSFIKGLRFLELPCEVAELLKLNTIAGELND